MTKIEESNKEQEKKFCPIIDRHCRRDCNFFMKAHYGAANPYSDSDTKFLKAYCRKN